MDESISEEKETQNLWMYISLLLYKNNEKIQKVWLISSIRLFGFFSPAKTLFPRQISQVLPLCLCFLIIYPPHALLHHPLCQSG